MGVYLSIILYTCRLNCEENSVCSVNNKYVMILYGPAGCIQVQECSAGDSGGWMYALVPSIFSSLKECVSAFISNSAELQGGAIMSSRDISFDFGHRMVFDNNSAGLDGGAMSLVDSASLIVKDEKCDDNVCAPSLIGNGHCDPQCMLRSCNW